MLTEKWRKWSTICIQQLKPNGVGVRKKFENLRTCGNYEHHLWVSSSNKPTHHNPKNSLSRSAPTPTPTPTPLTKTYPSILQARIRIRTLLLFYPITSTHQVGVNLKSLNVGGIGIGVDLEMGVIGGDGGIAVLWWMILLLNEEGESDPMRVLYRGFRIRGEGRVVEEGTA